LENRPTIPVSIDFAVHDGTIMGGETFRNCLGVGYDMWPYLQEKDYYAPGVGLIECETVQVEPRRIINRLKLIEYHVKK